ncbi:MAG TPA: porphobilinogen synthase [Chloroflexota bacterium]|nr:porphobilinogen synthase [Chloroflexota bacterium]
MSFPTTRLRRLRQNEQLRALARETVLSIDDLIVPLFFDARIDRPQPIEAMPGQARWPVREAAAACGPLVESGIRAVLLFGLPAHKDATGSSGWQDDGVVQDAIRAIKRAFPRLLVITDVCLCEYTDHGHCGLLDGQRVDNDRTLPLLARQALSHVASGADMVAPSDMMDGRVGVLRRALDEHGAGEVPIMAYSAKYASAFYGPFREAAESTPAFGDRRSYQMDPANAREALAEVALDVAEGADIVMVKPALAYLDVIRRVRDRFQAPVAAYNVSGEYSMVKAAAAQGWIDEDRVVREILTGIKRAGADLIITYHGLDAARWLRDGVWA